MLIVVDANVISAAALQSKSSFAERRATVLDALASDFRFMFSFEDVLQAEWGRCVSHYGATWLTDMIAQGRMRRIRPSDHAELRSALAQQPQNDREAAEKDRHLVELALKGGGRIISDEVNSRAKFALLFPQLPDLADLHWVGAGDVAILTWLQAGAPHQPAYLITTPARW